MRIDEVVAIAKAKAQVCLGSCENHSGPVQVVLVKGWGHFAYCDVAIQEDKSRGLDVSISPKEHPDDK